MPIWGGAGQRGRADRRGGGQRQRGRGLHGSRAEGGGQRRGQGVPGTRAAFPADQGSGGQLGGADAAAAARPGMAGIDDYGEPVMADVHPGWKAHAAAPGSEVTGIRLPLPVDESGVHQGSELAPSLRDDRKAA